MTFAREDLRVAELIYHEGIWNQVCFHSQQCVEKMLKAALMEQLGSIPRTHQLPDLLGRLTGAVSATLLPLRPDIQALDHFYAPTRYPDALPGTLPSGLPDRQEATEALSTAREVVRIIEDALK